MTELVATTTAWDVVNSLSCANFAVRNFGLKIVRGQVPVVSASVGAGADGRPVAVRATLDLSRIATGNARRDRDLRQPNLLGDERYPLLTFGGAAANGPSPAGHATRRR